MRYLLVFTVLRIAGAQTGQLSGTVIDSSGAALPSATLMAVNENTGIRRSTLTGRAGTYVLTGLWPGRHKVLVYRNGFQAVSRLGVTVGPAEHLRLDFTLNLSGVRESITVNDRESLLSGTPDTGVIEREYIDRIPANGRNLTGLLELVPGVVLTPVTSAELGQFSAAGQRTNANYFTVDGVSANFGVHGGGLPGQMAGGALPGVTAFGTMHTLGPVDSIEDVRVQTSALAAEYGRMPGAQVSITTLSGTNQHHGALFHNLRNEKLDANDWFANRQGFERAALRINGFGASAGGPVRRDRTFYFAAYEGLTVRQPMTVRLAVPSLAYRDAAPKDLRPLLAAFPKPTGHELGRGLAESVLSISRPSAMHTASIRIDQNVNESLMSFVRVQFSPSDVQAGELSIGSSRLQSAGATAGLNMLLGRYVSELRINLSHASATSAWELPQSGGAQAVDLAGFLPQLGSRDQSFYSFALAGSGQLQTGRGVWQKQRHFNLTESVSRNVGSHLLRAGIDYRRLIPSRGGPEYSIGAAFGGLDELFAGYASLLTFSRAEQAAGLVQNWSLYAQDQWRLQDRLTLSYGLRWEINPPPKSLTARPLYTVRGIADPTSISFAESGTPLWETRWNNLAPRLSIAYALNPRTTIRTGLAIFHDLGFGVAMDTATGAPYAKWSLLSGVRYPFQSPLELGGEQPPFLKTYAYPGKFHLPRTRHWTTALEQTLTDRSRLTLTYAGSSGSRLLRREALVRPNSEFVMVEVSTNRGSSSYHALQAQYSRRMTRRFDAKAAWTWSHSIDNVSQDSALLLGIDGFDATRDRGASSFDARHLVTAAFVGSLPQGWMLDGIFRTRTGFPIDVVNGEDLLGLGFSNVFRPDRVAMQPLWVANTNAPGGRELNRSAFDVPVSQGQGSLGRNAITGFGMWQVDIALRREFSLRDRTRVRLGAEIFNLLNHANFGAPDRFLISSLFGQPRTMLNSFLSSGGPSGGLSPVFQIGGPRSIQMSLRLSF